MARPTSRRTLSQRAMRLFRLRELTSRRSAAINAGEIQPMDVEESSLSKRENTGPSASSSLSISGRSSSFTSLDSLSSHHFSSSASDTSAESSCQSCPAPLSCPQEPLEQSQSLFFRKLPAEIREMIYIEYWRLAGIDRHVYIQDNDFCFAPCLADHDAPVDECQAGIDAAFRPSPAAQTHPQWFKRMNSAWCNHWKCEEAMVREATLRRKCGSESQKKGGDDGLGTCVPLLLTCKRLYDESLPSLHECTTLTITDKDTLHALFIRGRPRGCTSKAKHPVHAFLPRIQSLNISLRQGGPEFLYMHGPSLWRALSPHSLPGLRRISLWIDGCEPVSRCLLPMFREIWFVIPPEVARKLTVSLPVSRDGLWSWDEVECNLADVAWSFQQRAQMMQLQSQRRGLDGPFEDTNHRHHDSGGSDSSRLGVLPAFEPQFKVVLRGWPAYTPTCGDMVLRSDLEGFGTGWKGWVLTPNPFEDMKLYGRGHFDSRYP